MFKGFNQVNVYVEGQGIVKRTVKVEDGKIKAISNEDDKNLQTLDDNLFVVPGFVDQHVHGANHSDGMYPTLEDIENIATTIASEGVTSFLVTTMTQTVENIIAALENINNYIENENKKGAEALGVHLEGPFVSKVFKGAQPEDNIIPCDVDTFKKFEKASNDKIKLVTLAYEENGKELVRYLKSKGIVASLGHTNATADEALEGISEGITNATHTYNAMRGLHHREAGTLGAVLISDNVYCEVIADLVHVSPPALKLLFKAKGKDKVILVTDAMESKHLSPGKYQLGGQDVFVEGNEARLADGTLAGSTLFMNTALKNIHDVIGLEFTEVIDLATVNPAKNLNVYDTKGSIKVGKDADFTVIDKDFNVYLTITNGKVMYKK